MPLLKALRTLSGDYGRVTEGQQFEVSEEIAEQLEARGLASRVRVAPPTQPTIESFQPVYDTKVILPRKRRDS